MRYYPQDRSFERGGGNVILDSNATKLLRNPRMQSHGHRLDSALRMRGGSFPIGVVTGFRVIVWASVTRTSIQWLNFLWA